MARTKSAEKNDVDITQLFKWHKEVEIEDKISGISTKVYMRLVGDADLNRGRVMGYRASAELRQKLKTEGSDERLAFLSELKDYKQDKEILVKTLILLMIGDLQMRAFNLVSLPEPKEPEGDEASLEDWEEYQKQVDAYPAEFTKLLDKELEKLRKQEEKELSKLSIEELYDKYEHEIMNRLCAEEMENVYYDFCVFAGTFTDPKFKKRAFNTYEDLQNAHIKLKEILRENYRKLEVTTSELKK
jgi:vacuolar-type H+-ATPase subunit I/STV1